MDFKRVEDGDIVTRRSWRPARAAKAFIAELFCDRCGHCILLDRKTYRVSSRGNVFPEVKCPYQASVSCDFVGDVTLVGWKK